MKKVLNKSCI